MAIAVKDASQAVIWLTPDRRHRRAPQAETVPDSATGPAGQGFHPSLLVIPVGGKVEFPNHDPFFHNVFSLFEGKRFDLGLYESGTTRFVQFDKPGISFIFCNIHAEMSAVVMALATPYYAISDARGDLSIRKRSAGTLSASGFSCLRRRPTRCRPQRREITVAPGDTSLGTFTLAESDVTPGPQKQIRPRLRSPRTRQPGLRQTVSF